MGDILRRRGMMARTAEPTPQSGEYATADSTASILTSMMMPSSCVITYELKFIPDNNGSWTSIGHWNGFLGFEKRNTNNYCFNTNATGTRSYCSVSWPNATKEVWTAVEAAVPANRKVTISRYDANGNKKTGGTGNAAATPTSAFTVIFRPGNYVKRISLYDTVNNAYVNDIRVAVNNGRVCLHDIITDEYFYDANDSIYLADPSF